MSRVNEQWAANVLGMMVNPGKGPDIIGNKAFAEVKFTLLDSMGRYPQTWTTLEYQMDYPGQYPGRTGYWALGIYSLRHPVKEIDAEDDRSLEAEVRSRELYIVEWDWIYQFPPSPTSGETELTKWDNILRYPKRKFIPETRETHKARKGVVHLTKGVRKRDFPYLLTGIKEEIIIPPRTIPEDSPF